MRSQRRSARGTVGHPYSALNLRLALAVFGFVVSTALGVLAWAAGFGWLAILLFALAVTALVDMIVVELRRRARRREGGGRGSLFE
ncbi:hypothetical protein KZZ52_11190 [Dactylosporangium sp. AC04546]|uniref:hypothetical protein n=1 Tax=Dactylosporangium sp. AC04546 TaxID=2862460 RepID=UPI001EE09E5D|nr:hypothetical protein [Dactylosporangium sp. AC04546]WVK85912.1 hypothetical protein KZZ52_11190 [Dactylosporangium sp. AC04546]